MYVKPSRKQIRGVYVPENYHGTAFDEQEHSETEAMPTPPSEPERPMPTATPAPPRTADKQEGSGFSSLFSGLGSLRSDDILLLALILLLARSDKEGHSTAEILPMLAILLFIG